MNIQVPKESSNLIRKLFTRKKLYHFHVGIWSLFLGLLFNLFPQISNAQVNVPYWRESFSTAASGGTCNLTTTNPTSIVPAPNTDITYYFNGNGNGVWWGKNIYITIGTGCPAGNEHVRFRNMGASAAFDSGELVTPIVNYGIQEFHFYRARANRNYRIFITNDTGAQTTNWTLVANLPAWPNTVCADTGIIINSATAKRLKIQCPPGIDTDIDSIWLTNYSPQSPPLVPGNLIVQKVGTGNSPLTNQSAPFKLIQIGTNGTVIDSIQIPYTGPDKLVCQGSSSNDGQLTLSADKSKLVIMGYVADTGIATVSIVASISRSIKTVDINKNIVEIANGVLTGNARCAASNGTNAYLVGSSNGVMGGLGLNGNGLRDTISRTSTNNRCVQIHNNQLYFSTASSAAGSFGIYKVGTGTPNTPLVTSTVFLPVPNNISINQFAFNNDTNICYAADDNSGGGIKKFTRTGSTWSLVDSFEIAGISTARNVIVDWSSSNPIIYAIFGGIQLIKVTDIGSNLAAQTHQVLYVTSPNTPIRGLSFSPGTQFDVTTPTSITNNTISGDQNYCRLSQRDTIIGSTPSGGTGNYTYFWQVSSSSATTGFGSFSNNTGKNFMPISSLGNTWYRRIVTSGTFKDTSAVTKIFVNRVLNDSIYGPNEVCQGTTSLALRTKITSTLGVTSYSWLRSTTDSISGFTTATGTNNLVSYSPGTVNQTAWYKVVASSGTCLDTTKAFALRASGSPNSIIPGFSGTSSAQGGPIVGSAFQRGVTIYPATEVQDILSNGDSISKIGWVVQSVGGTAFSQGVSGQLKVYLVNTNDADMQRANSSSTWSGILSSPSAMSLCYDSAFTLPITVGAYFVRLQNKFAYTGQGIYVAFEWVPSTTTSSSTLNYALNLNILNGTFNGTSNSALPNTLNGTILRPRIVLGTNCATTPPPASLAAVSTRKAISITSSSAILGGDISSDGGASVTERGIVYSTNANPTISTGTKVAIGTGIGGFSQSISSLNASTTYYVRAYATNSVGTSYGADSSFTTTIATSGVPPSITGLKLWLDGSDVNNNGGNNPVNNTSITVWKDKSGASNDASVLSGQNPGVLTTNQINGKSVVNFTKTTDFIGSVYYVPGVDIRPVSMPKMTIFTVYKQGTLSSNQAVWGCDDGGWDRFFFSSFPSGMPSASDGGVAQGTYANRVVGAGIVGKTQLLTAAYDHQVPNGSAVYFNGASIATFGDSTHLTLAKPNLRIGFDGDDNTFNGNIAEMIVYDRKLTYCEILTINKYLGNKYGVSFASVSIDSSGPTSFRLGDSVVLSSSMNASSYQWLKNGLAISGANAKSFVVKESGDYQVVITNTCSDTSSFKQVNVLPTPIVSTSTISNISYNSATLGGNVTNIGGSAVTDRGVVYSTSINPTTSSGTKVQIGSGLGTFSQAITGLSPLTTYHVRAYALNTFGTSYGADSSFTTTEAPIGIAPTVITLSPALIFVNSATLRGNVLDSGSVKVTERGVVYSTSSNPTTSTGTKVIIGSGIGTFGQAINGLTAGTTYYFRAYAINSAGTSYGADSTFTTFAVATVPTVITNQPFLITFNAANMGGNVLSSGGANVTERGFVYNTFANPDTSTGIIRRVGFNVGSYGNRISTLSPATNYHVRAYAINSVGIAYGADSVFTTLPGIALVSTKAAQNITTSSAELGGIVSDTVMQDVTERGVVYSTTINPTISNATKVSIGAGLGNFSQTISGLTSATTYHVRAYAINIAGTAYGADSTFTTGFNPTPTITLTASFDPFSTCQGTASSDQQFTVSAVNLTANMSISAPTGFEVSLTLGSGYASSINLTPTSGTIATTTIYIRVSSSATGTPSGNISISSTGALSQDKAISATLTPLPVKPVISIQPLSPVCLGAHYLNFGASTAPASGVSYQWSAQNASLYAQGSTKQFSLISFPNSGTAIVTLTASSNGCSLSTETSIEVKSEQAPTATVRYFNKNFVCEANQVKNYQWGYDELPTLKGNILPNEINQNYYNAAPETATKSYWVISSSGNCYQKTYHATPLKVEETLINDFGIEVFPNPFNQQISIRSNRNLKAATVTIYDLNGRKLKTEQMNGNEHLFEVNELSAGIYMMFVEDENGQVSSLKIVKQ